jgi:hypothetical protein
MNATIENTDYISISHWGMFVDTTFAEPEYRPQFPVREVSYFKRAFVTQDYIPIIGRNLIDDYA